MIGHFLLTLTPTEEDRVLTGKLGRMQWWSVAGDQLRPEGGCILQVVSALAKPRPGSRHMRECQHSDGWSRVMFNYITRASLDRYERRHHVGFQYDALIQRFGVERINAAIRNRILANQWRRERAGQATAVAV